jgi:hypothetical protein
MNNKIETEEEVIVYWAPHAHLSKQHQQILLDIKPKSLMSEIQKRRATSFKQPPSVEPPYPGEYQSCSALHTLTNNMFVIKAPFSAEIKLDSQGVIKEGQKYGRWFKERISSLQNAYAIDFDLSYMFFSEESLDLTITPPYMHRTNQAQQGFISSVSFDISSWFRPYVLIYQLWEGVDTITIENDEPIAYLKFNTKKKVVLKPFKLTPYIENQVNACLEHKYTKPHESMEELYDRFHRTGMHERVAKEIKENVIN